MANNSLFRKTRKLALTMVSLVAVTTACANHEVTPQKSAARSTLPKGVRRPADVDSDTAAMPPTGRSIDAWLYTWTNRPRAISDAEGDVASQLSYTQDCLKKFQASVDAVHGCEGDGMASGPGIYACDNPFTSQDYGATMVAIRAIGGNTGVALATGPFAAPPASDGLDRAVYANVNFTGIIYDFRLTAFNDRAVVLRSADLVDVSKSYSVSTAFASPQSFKNHAPFKCAANTSVKDIVEHWGDLLNFMGITYVSERDLSQKNFVSGSQLNAYGIAAAIAADSVAMPPAALRQRVAKLSSLASEIKDSLTSESCLGAGTLSPTSCLSHLLYSSIVGEQGTPRNPTGAWSPASTVKALGAIGILSTAQAAKVKTSKDLLLALQSAYPTNSPQMQRAMEAYGCMMSVKAQVQPNELNRWGADPQFQ